MNNNEVSHFPPAPLILDPNCNAGQEDIKENPKPFQMVKA